MFLCANHPDEEAMHETPSTEDFQAAHIEALEAKVKELEIVVLGRNAVIATLENKLAESRVALHKYGKHIDGCTYGIPQPRFCENPCTCGLRDLLN